MKISEEFKEFKESLVNPHEDLPGLFLKLVMLSASLRSDVLEEWLTYESQGYPLKMKVPPYRKTSVTYRGRFRGVDGAIIDDVQIPSSIITEHAGKHWLEHDIRLSIPVVSELLKGVEGDGYDCLVESSELILQLQDKVYEGYWCIDVRGSIARGSLANIDHSVRHKLLELLIRIEKEFPELKEASDGNGLAVTEGNDGISGITGQVIYGNVTNIGIHGGGAVVNLAVVPYDISSLVGSLKHLGLPEAEAVELAEVVADGKPEEGFGPLNRKTMEWLSERLRKLGNGVWDGGISIVTKVLSEVVSQYYGIGK